MANDTIGIEITNKEFNSLIKESLNQLSDSTFEKDSSYCINFIRIVNTIEKNNLFAKYKDVRDVFYEKVYKEALVKLNASFYKGGAFYCQDYNLFIGGAPHYNSQYIIIDN